MQGDKFSQFEDYCIRHSIVTGQWATVPPQSQVLEVRGYIKDSEPFVFTDFLLYVRTDRTDDWWGITYNVFEKIVASSRRWLLVLLLGDGERGYLLTGTQVDGMRRQFSRGGEQYHLHDKHAAKGRRFESFEQLCRMLTAS